jgi:superfamily II DNA or RNA helicase
VSKFAKQVRGYQIKAQEVLRQLFVGSRRVLLVSPTGSGKSVMGAEFVEWFLRRNPRARVLWLAHRTELINQAERELGKAGLRSVGVLSGVRKTGQTARVLVASVQTLVRREVPHFDLVVVDEAHRVEAESYKAILAALPKSRVLGLTATPWRLDGKPLGETFQRMYITASMTELIALGWLARPVAYGVTKDKAKAMVARLAKSQGDYSAKELERAMMRGQLMGDIVQDHARRAGDKPTLVFAAGREHGKALAKRFREAGRTVEYLDGETPAKEREALLARLASGETQIVVNVDVLTEGFDCPDVKCVVLARPTRSRTRFLQYCGRASRPTGDKRSIILDHAGNCWRHKLPDHDHEWSLKAREKRDGENAPIKVCASCGALIPLSAPECPECGAKQPMNERDLREKEAELERLKAEEKERARKLTVLKGIAKARGLPASWAEKALQEIAS